MPCDHVSSRRPLDWNLLEIPVLSRQGPPGLLVKNECSEFRYELIGVLTGPADQHVKGGVGAEKNLKRTEQRPEESLHRTTVGTERSEGNRADLGGHGVN